MQGKMWNFGSTLSFGRALVVHVHNVGSKTGKCLAGTTVGDEVRVVREVCSNLRHAENIMTELRGRQLQDVDSVADAFCS